MPKVTREHSITATRKAAMESPIKKEKKNTKEKDNTVYGEILPADEKQLIDLIQAFPKGISSVLALQHLDGWSINDLVTVGNSLSKKDLIEIRSSSSGAGNNVLTFVAVSEEEVHKLRSMDANEKIIYGYIKEAGSKGIWQKDLKIKSGIHQKQVLASLKALEKRKIIKTVKSIKNSIKRVYMLYELAPSDEVTGGTFYQDNELDVEFIEILSHAIYRKILKDSMPTEEDQLLPANYPYYPTVSSLSNFLNNSDLFRSGVSLDNDDVQGLLDRLVYDGKIERRLRTSIASNSIDDDDDTWMYKAVNTSKSSETTLTCTPCGQCPIFKMCSDLGEVNPSSCEYFSKWLEF
ncbi:RNA polymerase Rpc34 [Anaeromyces robustus]|uniref:DNA-directed RNA polymerase III subunit RPC6 n=1 Tax=Anaeromyces robustus TaxID=1754192 RepID=A0A1Y1VSY9_9FUNG|nr:RNA polymerase Rpc34 [Anaeromyces robustus]|eukprot:ORX64422.1 RNA polymerase Rpc34 [Anaeromyces robustus]